MDQFNMIVLASFHICFTCITIAFSHSTDERIVTNSGNNFKVIIKSKRFKKYDNTAFDQSKTGHWTYLENKKTATILECAGDCLNVTRCTGFFFLSAAEKNCLLNERVLRSDQRKVDPQFMYFEVKVNYLYIFSNDFCVILLPY